jgi:hypothetical protein
MNSNYNLLTAQPLLAELEFDERSVGPLAALNNDSTFTEPVLRQRIML